MTERKTALVVTLAAVAVTIGAFVASNFVSAVAAAPSRQDGEFPMEKPGPEHKRLAAFAGTWDQVSKWRMDPAAEFEESKGVETIKVVCGGFWILTESVGTMMGMPMEGRMQLGYDFHKKKYVGSWIDNFGSYLTTMEGSYDAKTKTLTMTSDMFDPSTGSTMKVKLTTEDISADETLFKMHFPTPDGKEFVAFEIRSKRRK
jgi:hypothetical protein